MHASPNVISSGVSLAFSSHVVLPLERLFASSARATFEMAQNTSTAIAHKATDETIKQCESTTDRSINT